MASRHAVRNVHGEHVKAFVRIVEGLAYRRSRWEVFSDWVTMAACALRNAHGMDPAVEEEYLAAARRYTGEELGQMVQLLPICVQALEERLHDFMGVVFEGLELASADAGQFFTPYEISRFMAEATIGARPARPGRILTISDPACGAGGMLVAVADVLAKAGVNFQREAFFHAQDIDPRCARMAYVHLSLIGASAVVVCGNTLSMQTSWAWPTLMYRLTAMGPRLRAQQASDDQAAEPRIVEPIVFAGAQGSWDFELVGG